MIGQTEILNNVDYWIKTGTVPRFIIIGGARGCGKTVLAKEISRRMGAYLIECGMSVDDVRDAVKNCYKCSAPTVYLFNNADKMSTSAKNAMLKITEEPPRQAHFIVNVQNFENMLETLRSRATNIQMAPYSEEELKEFYNTSVKKKVDLILELSDTPGMMLELEAINIDELISFCETVVDNIQVVTGVNAFKIGQRIKVKDGGEGWDADLFFHVLTRVLFKRAVQCAVDGDLPLCTKYASMLELTCRYRREFNLTGVKKDSTLDMWILEMRECK